MGLVGRWGLVVGGACGRWGKNVSRWGLLAGGQWVGLTVGATSTNHH